MIEAIDIAPSLELQPYIKCFTYREVNAINSELSLPLFAVPEMYLTFYLNTKPPLPQNFTGTNYENFVFGLQTHFQGIVHFNGYFKLFLIVFKPNGFYKIFGIPPGNFTNIVSDATGFFSSTIDRLLQQLQEANNFSRMVMHAEKFLLFYLQKVKVKDPYNCIQYISNLLLRHSGNISMEQLASDANMSMKTFERNFTAQVGISPKLFARIVRFNTALALKMKHEKRDWTYIAHQCGYFDQMHFIKDFKQFAGVAPTSFFTNTPPPKENIIENKELE